MSTIGSRLHWWTEGAPPPRLAALLADPDGVLQGPGSFARERGGRKRFYRLEGAAGEPALFVKVFTLPAGWPRLRYLLRPSKARRELAIAHAIVARGFDAVVPIAVGEERRWDGLRRSLTVSVERRGARDLRAVLEDPGLAPPARRDLVIRFAELTRRMHDEGIDQDDTAPNNFLCLGDGRFALIDFERCHLRTRPLGRRRDTLLAKLSRRVPMLSRTDHLRFLRAYQGMESSRAERRLACERIAQEMLRIRRRDARHARAAAFESGRHLARLGGSWVMIEREHEPTLRIDLPRKRAREAWIRAHQLERLGLPALRPVRLDESGIDLVLPAGARTPRPDDVAVRRALRVFAPWGRFVEPPEWRAIGTRVLLANPQAFSLEIPGRRIRCARHHAPR